MALRLKGKTTNNQRQIPPEVIDLAQEVYLMNSKYNELKRAHDALRQKLYVEMKDKKIKPFSFTHLINEKMIAFDVAVEIPIVDMIDIKKLKKLVDEKIFLQIVKATKKDVVAYVGAEIMKRTVYQVEGTENVVVRGAEPK